MVYANYCKIQYWLTYTSYLDVRRFLNNNENREHNFEQTYSFVYMGRTVARPRILCGENNQKKKISTNSQVLNV